MTSKKFSFGAIRARRKVDVLSHYREVFSTPLGEKILLDLCHEHYLLKHTFDANPLEMAFKEGQRNVILRILSNMKLDIKAMLQKIEEEERKEQALNQEY